MGLWVWDQPDDHYRFSMDLSLWDAPVSQQDNEDDSLSLGYYGRGESLYNPITEDVIEEEGLNGKYCLQALNIMNGNTQEEDVHYPIPGKLNILEQNLKNGNTQQQQKPQSLDNNNIECPKTNKRKSQSMDYQVDTSPTPMKMKRRDSLAFKDREMEPQISTQNVNDHQIRVGTATNNNGQKPIKESTVVQLRAICKSLDLKGYTTFYKAELIKLLEQTAPHLF